MRPVSIGIVWPFVFVPVLLFFPPCRICADGPAVPTPDTAPPAKTTDVETPSFPDADPEHKCSLWQNGTFGGDGPADTDANKPSPLWDNLSFFGGLDGSKEPEDLGVNAHFGFRAAVNAGFPLLEQEGLGVQAGTALNYSQNAVRVLKYVDRVTDDLQSFTTIGLFQRSPVGVNWGLVFDFRIDDYYQNMSFGQWRGQVGYDLGADNEVGLKAAVRAYGQSVTMPASFDLRPITQGDLFWKHIWENEIVTSFWVGLAEGHGRFDLAAHLLGAPADPPVHHPLVFGAEVFIPLTDQIAIFGEANFITPNDTGTVDATLGIAFYPGAGARRAPRSRFAPLLPLGNNSSFAVDLRQ